MEEIIPAFEESIFDSNLSSVLKDVTEIGIDSIVTNAFLKDIPIVNLVLGFKNTVLNIIDRVLLENTLEFIKEFNSKKIDSVKLENYRKKVKNEKEKELSRVIILLNTFIDIEKSKMLADFYVAYIDDKITWDDFCELSDVLNRIFISDIELLFKIYNGKIKDTTCCNLYQIERLNSLGLINISLKNKWIIGHDNLADSIKTEKFICISSFGMQFCKYSEKCYNN